MAGVNPVNLVGRGGGEAALHEVRLCDLLHRLVSSTQGSGFQKDAVDGAPDQPSLSLLLHPFYQSESDPSFFVLLSKPFFVHLT